MGSKFIFLNIESFNFSKDFFLTFHFWYLKMMGDFLEKYNSVLSARF